MHLFKVTYNTTTKTLGEFADSSTTVIASDAEKAIKKAIKEERKYGRKRVIIRSCEYVAAVEIL